MVRAPKRAIRLPWLQRDSGGDSSTRTASRASTRSTSSAACLVTRSCGSSRSCGGGKNGLRHLWPRPATLVGPADAARARSLVWRYPGLARVRRTTGCLPYLRQGEAGANPFSLRQSLPHQAFRVFCPMLRPDYGDARDAARLEWGKFSRQVAKSPRRADVRGRIPELGVSASWRKNLPDPSPPAARRHSPAEEGRAYERTERADDRDRDQLHHE